MSVVSQWVFVIAALSRQASAVGECRLLRRGRSRGFWPNVVSYGRLIIFTAWVGECESEGILSYLRCFLCFSYLLKMGCCM